MLVAPRSRPTGVHRTGGQTTARASSTGNTESTGAECAGLGAACVTARAKAPCWSRQLPAVQALVTFGPYACPVRVGGLGDPNLGEQDALRGCAEGVRMS